MTWKHPKMEAGDHTEDSYPEEDPDTRGSFCKQAINLVVLSHTDFGVFLLLQQNLDQLTDKSDSSV